MSAINLSSIDDEWNSFVSCENDMSKRCYRDDPSSKIDTQLDDYECTELESEPDMTTTAPECQDLYISTKTKVLFLNQHVDIHDIFWKIPVIEYGQATEGVIKKQMKIISKTPEEYEEYKNRLKDIYYYKENIIKQINNPNARRIKFKDERKITIGVSKKDIMACRGKVKGAFYNCFAIIIRFMFESQFREIHVKVFNTGKMEIPGILSTKLLIAVRAMVKKTMEPYLSGSIDFVDDDTEDDNVLINSNFKCGFYINRPKLYKILTTKYGIQTAFDHCNYPGVKCKFYFNNELGFNPEIQKGTIDCDDRKLKMNKLDEDTKYTKVSFMIFRTGSCLIVGNCSEKILVFIYEFIKKILHDEYHNICIANDDDVLKTKKTKLRKKTITITH
jgi:hypothetical protein